MSEKTKNKKGEVEVVPLPHVVEADYTPPREKKIVAPIKRIRMGTPVSHETNFKFQDAYEKLRLPIINPNGKQQYKNPFRSKEEQEWLEKELGADLNIYKKEDNYFDFFEVKLGKTPVPFDLSNPNDLLAVRVLEQNTDIICTDPNDRLNKITYKWILSKDGFQEIEKEQMGERSVEIWGFYNKIKDDKDALVSFLRLRGFFPPANSSLKWLAAQVVEELNSNPTECYIQIKDEDREYKVLMDKALESRAVIYSGEDGYIIKGDTHSFANNKANVILYFKDPRNAEDVARIKAHIKTFEDKYK